MTAMGMGEAPRMMPRIAPATTGMMTRHEGNAARSGGFPGKDGEKDMEEMIAAVRTSMSSWPRSGPESDRRRMAGARSASSLAGHAQARGVLGGRFPTGGRPRCDKRSRGPLIWARSSPRGTSKMWLTATGGVTPRAAANGGQTKCAHQARGA